MSAEDYPEVGDRVFEEEPSDNELSIFNSMDTDDAMIEIDDVELLPQAKGVARKILTDLHEHGIAHISFDDETGQVIGESYYVYLITPDKRKITVNMYRGGFPGQHAEYPDFTLFAAVALEGAGDSLVTPTFHLRQEQGGKIVVAPGNFDLRQEREEFLDELLNSEIHHQRLHETASTRVNLGFDWRMSDSRGDKPEIPGQKAAFYWVKDYVVNREQIIRDVESKNSTLR